MRSRSMPLAFRSPAQRSPTFLMRAVIVLIVNASRSTPASTSFQVMGAETPAYALARALYAVASVLPGLFVSP